MAFARVYGRTTVHLDNSQKRRGFLGLRVAASCGSRLLPRSAREPTHWENSCVERFRDEFLAVEIFAIVWAAGGLLPLGETGEIPSGLTSRWVVRTQTNSLPLVQWWPRPSPPFATCPGWRKTKLFLNPFVAE